MAGSKAHTQHAIATGPRVRRAAALVLCVLGTACGTPAGHDVPAAGEGGDLELRLRNTRVLWSADVQRAADMLARQRPAGFDKPLRLTLVVRPAVLVDSEITIRFAVDAQGHVEDAEVLKAAMATGDQSIAVATLAALRRWRFDPPARAGSPAAFCCIRLTIENIADQPRRR